MNEISYILIITNMRVIKAIKRYYLQNKKERYQISLKMYSEDYIALLLIMDCSYALVECQKIIYENILCYIFTARKNIL